MSDGNGKSGGDTDGGGIWYIVSENVECVCFPAKAHHLTSQFWWSHSVNTVHIYINIHLSGYFLR